MLVIALLLSPPFKFHLKHVCSSARGCLCRRLYCNDFVIRGFKTVVARRQVAVAAPLVSIGGGLVPQRAGLPVVPLSVVVGTDVPVVLVPYAGFTQVLGVVASGVMERVFNARHAAVAEEVADS